MTCRPWGIRARTWRPWRQLAEEAQVSETTASTPLAFRVHTADSWARAIIATAVQGAGPAGNIEIPVGMTVVEFSDGVGVTLQIGDVAHSIKVGT